MPRPSAPPRTRLGAEIRARRGACDQEQQAAVLCLSRPTLSRLERGTTRPTYDTALKLTQWLGWSIEQVMDAAAPRVLFESQPPEMKERS
jgi:transcriptional regulator with XRE-family HTH domain